MSTDGAVFGRELRARVRAALANGPQTFREVVRQCGGAYPTLVAEVLRDPEFESRTHATVFERVEAIPQSPSLLATLEGNPSLCAWYFTDNTCSRVAQMRSWSDKRIAFLGTPRLFEWFERHSVARECVLFDADVRVLELLRETNAYLPSQLVFYEVPNSHAWGGQAFDCVFFDPPWYPEVYPQWLARASQLAPGGVVAFALFPELTRPSAKAERRDIVSSAQCCSSFVTLVSGFLEYDVPTFERAELEASGLTEVFSWKFADMVIVDGIDAREVSTADRPNDTWCEVDIGNLRIFVAGNPRSNVGSPLLMPLPDGSVRLRSPSRRDPARAASNVLSSRGHGAVTSNPTALVESLRRIASAIAVGGSLDQALGSAKMDDESRRLLAEMIGDVNE